MSVRQENVQVNVEINGKRAGATIADLEKNLKAVRRELRHLPDGSEEFIKKSKEFDTINNDLKKMKGEAFGVGKAMNGSAGGVGVMTKATNGLKFAFQAAMAALLPLLAFQQIIEWGRHILGVEEKFTKLKGTIQTMTGATGDELDRLVVKTQAISQTFDKEANEIVKAQNVLAEQMKITNDEALDLIEKGLLAGADLNGDFLEQISEYAPQFKQAGIAAEDFVAELVKAEGAGIFSDKGADVVKEFGLRIREQATATKDAMDSAFGPEYTAELFKGINDGSITTVDALKSVSKQMSDNKIPAKELQTVVADVFGGAGEDAGIEYLLSLQNIGGELDNMIDVTNSLTGQQLERLELEKELAEVQNLMAGEYSGASAALDNLYIKAEIFALKALQYVIDQFVVAEAQIKGAMSWMSEFGKSFSRIWEAIKSGDMSAIFDSFKNIGKGSGEAYSKAYNKVLDEEEANRKKQVEQKSKEDREAAIKAAEERAAGEGEAERKERQKQAEKLKQAREKYQQDVLKADKAIEDLRIELIKDSTEREIAQLNLNAQRKIEALVGSPEQIAEQQALIEEQLLRGIEQTREKQAEAEREAREKTYQERLEEEAEREEIDMLRLEEKFLLGLETEQERFNSQYELERAAMESRLELIKNFHGEESLEYARAKNQILVLDKDHQDQILENEKRTQELKAKVLGQGFDAAQSFLQLGIDLMSEDEEARKKNAKKIKAFQVAATTIDLIKEVQSIWSGAAQLGPILGPIMGAIQTGIAVVRGGMAISKINSQKFALGGLLKSANKYAGGGIVKGPKHSQGGVPFFNPNSGTIDEMEGDEIILTGGVSRDPRLKAVASMINRAAGGRMFAAGGPVNPYRIAAEAAVNGGSTAQAMEQATGQQQAQLANPASDMLITEVRGLRSDVQSMNTRLKAYVVYSEIEDAQEEVAEVRNDASIQP